MQTNQDQETRRQGDEETRSVIHAFPSRSFIDHATAGLLMLQERTLNLAPSNNVQRLLARHAPARPQAPMKPAA